mmetsp:Transcript_15522/g.43022  ORF Transcript_15522/g.43022 Transcript_15522/m.43022 type:complete len:516 (-) Transcript_15522:308-1855(-)
MPLHGIVPVLAVIDKDFVALLDGPGGYQIDHQSHSVLFHHLQRVHLQEFLVMELLPTGERLAGGLGLGVLVRVPLNLRIRFNRFDRGVGIVDGSVIDRVNERRRRQPQQTRFGMPVHVIQQELLFFGGKAVFGVVPVQLGLVVELLVLLPVHVHFFPVDRNHGRRREDFSRLELFLGKEPALAAVVAPGYVGCVVRKAFLDPVVEANAIAPGFAGLELDGIVVLWIEIVPVVDALHNQFFSRQNIAGGHKHGVGQVGETPRLWMRGRIVVVSSPDVPPVPIEHSLHLFHVETLRGAGSDDGKSRNKDTHAIVGFQDLGVVNVAAPQLLKEGGIRFGSVHCSRRPLGLEFLLHPFFVVVVREHIVFQCWSSVLRHVQGLPIVDGNEQIPKDLGLFLVVVYAASQKDASLWNEFASEHRMSPTVLFLLLDGRGAQPQATSIGFLIVNIKILGMDHSRHRCKKHGCQKEGSRRSAAAIRDTFHYCCRVVYGRIRFTIRLSRLSDAHVLFGCLRCICLR